jgi:predicted membrane protein
LPTAYFCGSFKPKSKPFHKIIKKMNTNEKNKSSLYAILSIALMVGGGILLSWTLNDLYPGTSALVTLSLALFSVFIYLFGANWIGRSIKKRTAHHSYKEVNGGILFAFLLIATGALIICFNTELLTPVWKPFFISWQMLLFVIGAISLCRGHFIWGTLFSVAGIFLLVEKAPNFIRYEHFTSTFWPVIFIVIGIVIVLSFFKRPQFIAKWHIGGKCLDSDISNETENNDGKINYRLAFSGTEQVILDPVFRGGTIDVTFGGMELDLRHTSLAEGKTVLHVNVTFGGVEISAPDTWDIELVSKTFAGATTDDRRKKADLDRTRKLVIVSKCSFGGIEIK